MTTTNQNPAAGLRSRTEQRGANSLLDIDHERRFANRALNTDKVLWLLHAEAPRLFHLAEVVGSWVWIQFESKQPPEVTRILAQLGFHWNKNRQTWQHPCGVWRKTASKQDPRSRFRSYFPADHAQP